MHNLLLFMCVAYKAFTMEQDIPDYDMDSDDEKWITSQAGKLDITPLQVEMKSDRKIHVISFVFICFVFFCVF